MTNRVQILVLRLALVLSNLLAQNVGIGTSTPVSRLHVAGTNATLTVGPFGIGQSEGRIVATGSAAEISFVRRTLTTWPTSPQPGDRFAWHNPDGTARLWSNADLVWVTAGGYVGIGTSPGVPLHVRKDAPASQPTAAFLNASGVGVYIGHISGTGTYGSVQGRNGGSSANLILQENGGLVGIGINTPQVKLHVVDVIEASAPDYNQKSASITGDGSVELLRNPNSGALPCTGIWGYIDFKNLRSDDHDGRILYGDGPCSPSTPPTEGFYFLRGLGGQSSIGTYTSTGWGHSSDGRLKTDVHPLSGALERVMRLRPVYFRWKNEPHQRQVGFIAQEVADVFPEVVSQVEDTYVLYHGSLTAPLAGAIQELYQIIEAQREEIRQLKARIEALERSR